MTQKNDLVNRDIDSLNRLIVSENLSSYRLVRSENYKFLGRMYKIDLKVIWHAS